jgi:hypothetical protein
MVKKALLLIILTNSIFSNELLNKNCLNCHQSEQLPTELIYKRYLMKYSTNDRIFNALYKYLKKPNINDSIMPKAFFFKYPIKNRLKLKDDELKTTIKEFLKEFDIKKRLKLEQNSTK